MTRKIIQRPAAQADISDIWDYSATRWDMDQADRYVLALRTSMEMLAQHPLAGSDCSDLEPGLRRIRSQSHVIFYLHGDDVIDVVRVLHERMAFDVRLRRSDIS